MHYISAHFNWHSAFHNEISFDGVYFQSFLVLFLRLFLEVQIEIWRILFRKCFTANQPRPTNFHETNTKLFHWQHDKRCLRKKGFWFIYSVEQGLGEGRSNSTGAGEVAI